MDLTTGISGLLCLSFSLILGCNESNASSLSLDASSSQASQKTQAIDEKNSHSPRLETSRQQEITMIIKAFQIKDKQSIG